MQFLSSLISKKLAFAVATDALIQSLHMSADAKGIATAAVAVAFLIAQAWVDAHGPKPTPGEPAQPAKEPTDATPPKP